MQAATDRLEFAPPQQPGFVRSLTLALLAHLLLLGALTWGVQWKRESENLTVEAELWSAVPQQAAPKLVEAPPPPPPPPPPPQARVETPPPPPVVKDADIALEREKKRRELEKQREAEKEKQRALEEKQEQKKKAEADKKKQEAREKQLEKEREKERQEKKELDAKRKADAEARQQKEADAKRQEAQRLANIQRAQGLAGATGGPSASGSALQSSGPSASYAGRIRGRVKPNIVFTEDIAGNPVAEIEVRTAPDGTIVGRRVLKSSGSKSWDEAVLKAIDKTETFPRDTDGRVPPLMILEFKPKD
jgi:colicin import membrane protein